MNKKLRRLLRRKDSSKDSSVLQQKTSKERSLSFLLKERTAAQPNHYFKSNNPKDIELQIGDLKIDDKKLVIAENVQHLVVEKPDTDIEIALTPMKREPDVQRQKDEQLSAPQPEPTVENQAKDTRSFHVPPPSNGHQQITNRLLATNPIVSNLLEQLQANHMTPLTFPIVHNVSTHSIPAIPSPRVQNPISHFSAPPPCGEPHNRNVEKSNPCLTTLPADTPGTSNKREVCRVQQAQIRHTCLPMTERLGGRHPPVIGMDATSANVPHNLLLLGHASTEQQSIFGSEKIQECFVKRHAHLEHSQLWNPQHFLQHGSSSVLRIPNDSVDPPRDICTPEAHYPFCSCENHDIRSPPWWHQCDHHGKTPIRSSCTCCCPSSRDHCNVASQSHRCCPEKPVWPKEVARCSSCDAQQPCAPHTLQTRLTNGSGSSSQVISVSIAGESQPRIVELSCPFPADGHTHPGHCCAERLDRTGSHDQSTFRTCKRHLEEGICSSQCQDCMVHCDTNDMPPSLLIDHRLSQTEWERDSESHCSCCRRIIRERKESHPRPSAQNNLGHFQISPRSYAKLLAYIESKKALMQQTINTAGRFDSRATFNGFDRRTTNNNEFSFLSRKPTHACNEYSTMGPQRSIQYQNQTVSEMVRLAKVLQTVEECPWYWGEVSNVEAKKILQGTQIGTFILRDSSDSRYLFSVSVMTSRGPTSIRVVYWNGAFRFDSDGDEGRNIRRKLHVCNDEYRQCVVHMILHYTKYLVRKTSKTDDSEPRLSKNGVSKISATSSNEKLDETIDTNSDSESSERGQFMCSWVSRSGRKTMPVLLSKPQSKTLSSLQQLSRFSLNKHLKLWRNREKVQELPLPSTLQAYLKKYPYPI